MNRAALESMIKGVPGADTIVCGSDQVALEVQELIHELGRDFHVIADSELSPKRVWVTTLSALGQFEGGGRN